ncbi:hypothetical protein DOE78_03510 [Bacillus sp. Y1]|nr:hypothetical protein DOE78_03510 [Bacillus sp. Y1]
MMNSYIYIERMWRMLNMGDLLFQILSMLLMVGFVTVFIYILVSYLNRSKKPSSTAIEEKLDRIIELLEQERKRE